LRWLAFSIEVLKLEELSEIFVLHPEQAIPINMEERLFRPEDVLRNFSGLVTTKAVGAGGETACTRVSLVHFSVKEYLISSRISKGPASFFAFSEADAHTHIAHSCLEYLIYTSSPNGMIFDGEFIMRSYARKYWPQHLEMVPRGLWTAQVTNAITRALAADSPTIEMLLSGLNYKLQYRRTPFRLEHIPRRPLCYAALNGNVQLSEMLLLSNAEQHSELHVPLADLEMGLLCAVYGGSLDVIRLVLHHLS